MFQLFADSTPNARKVSIMLEEIKENYQVSLIDIDKGDQFREDFKKISPFSKIPVLKNLKTGESYFESGAILIYLANYCGDFYGENKDLTNQWLMIQMAYVGPMIGQHHQFHHYHPGKSSFGEDRYFQIAKTIYERLDDHLSHNEYLAKTYSIADIATFPWIARHPIHDIGLKKYPNLTRWYNLIKIRPAVLKGYDLFKKDVFPPLV
ncbi:glutathione S-transferase [Alphaproteobacteria bacterium]|nr:glutathione S-transferase [Alphaproteobacteria bacterium]